MVATKQTFESAPLTANTGNTHRWIGFPRAVTREVDCEPMIISAEPDVSSLNPASSRSSIESRANS